MGTLYWQEEKVTTGKQPEDSCIANDFLTQNFSESAILTF